MRRLFYYILILLVCHGMHGVEAKDNIPLSNQKRPLKGEVTLDISENITISADSHAIGDKNHDWYFDKYKKSNIGDIFLLNSKEVRIHRFNKEGKYINSFLRKGEGPGEFQSYPNIQTKGDSLYVMDFQKIAEFSFDGKLLREIKLKNPLSSITIVNDHLFTSTSLEFPGDNTGKTLRVCKLFDMKNVDPVKTLFRTTATGMFYIKVNKRPMAVTPDPGIIPNLIYAFDPIQKKVYAADNYNYKISVLDLQGKSESVIQLNEENAILKPSHKKDIVAGFGKLPPGLEKQIIQNLPGKLCAIQRFLPLPSGQLLVWRITDYNKTELNLFSNVGKFLYRIKLPKDNSIKDINFYDEIITGIESQEEMNVYREYKIQSFSKIFSN